MTYFISEISSNHNQDLDRVKKLIERSKSLGFDAVKFQLFKIEELFSPEIISKSEFHSSRKAWELPVEFIPEIHKICVDNEIELGITPFYLDAVDECNQYVDFFKIASYEILWKDLFKKCLSTDKDLIFSTGMANLSEVSNAFSFIGEKNKDRVTLLHCSSAYPTPTQGSNLKAIKTLRDKFLVKTGWSDHTRSVAVLLAACLKWNSDCIEIHFDIDGQGAEADGHCWLPDECSRFFELYHEALESEGDGLKEPNPFEYPDRDWRADPSDGLRPFKKLRTTFNPES